MISGKTRVLGLIGRPVAHSLSPQIHNFFADRLGVDSIYTAFDVGASDLATAVNGAYALGFGGLNITYPHKTVVMEFVRGVDKPAEIAQSINTLKRTPDGFFGYNTDIIGVARAISHFDVNPAGETAVILGAGAAARSAAVALAGLGCGKMVIANRSRDAAEDLARMIGAQYGILTEIYNPADIENLGGKILINAIALDADFAPQADNFDIYFDMNYATGNPYGLAMLAYQAAAAYEIFTDINVPQNIVSEIIANLNEINGKGGKKC